MSFGGGNSKSGVCFEWKNKGTCSRRNCKFSHSGGPTNSGGGTRNRFNHPDGPTNSIRGGGSRNTGGRGGGVCHQFRDTGFCRFGNGCKFPHFGGGGGGASASSKTPRIQRSSDDTKNFIKHLSVLPVHKLGTELSTSSALWRRCWQDHKSLDDGTRRMMIEILAKTPGSSSVEPPSIDLCEQAFQAFLKSHGNVSDGALLTQVKVALNAIKRLLQFEWEPPKQPVKEGICNVVLLAEGKLKKQIKEHRNVSNDLMDVLDDLDKPWRIRIKQLVGLSDEALELEDPVSYADWKSANVKWLCTSQFFAPSSCPAMKVGADGVYESDAEYMDTMHRLWVAMTFADGHAAFAPHCRTHGQSGSGCNNALWPVSTPVTGAQQNLRCRTKGCSRPVEFACRMRNHDALCGDCASRSIACHLDGPGQHASTHIYDCKVNHVGQDGIVYLSEFKSRNPPPKIHWRTTKRLSPPNLVGLVKSRSKGGLLIGEDQIKWGECVYHGQSKDEDRRRENGDLAINISTIIEFDPDFFEEGSYVAVIDCMTFVPEWIPVLKAVEGQTQARLPFDNGRHLNLFKGNPAPSNSILNEMSRDDIFASDRRTLIEGMVDESSLEPIREIKRNADLKETLVTSLESLVKETTLDRMQLVSFIDSLRHPVHLTQGPPGTGKSYLGVVIVRSLMIIRDLWLKRSKSIVSPPILVLSYKNHAIDEFLSDLVQAEPNLRVRNKLIRIGGQCKDPRLSSFSERNTYMSDGDVKNKRLCLERLNTLRNSINATLSGNVTSFLCHRQEFLNETDPRIRQKAAAVATDILMEMIVRRSLLKTAILSDMEGSTPLATIEKLGFLEITQTREASNKLRALVAAPNGAIYVPKLQEEIKHYDDNHWGDVLLMWLCGKIPLRPCSFNIGTGACGKRACDPETNFCDLHRCSFQSEESTRCLSRCLSDKSRLCIRHCCALKNCLRPVFTEAQGLCESHCCRRCIELDGVSKVAVDRPPRNFCQDHPACLFPSCLLQCIIDSMYCREHEISKCLALTKRGIPCKGVPVSRFTAYCRDHLNLESDMDFGTEALESDDENEEENSNLPPPISLAHRVVCSSVTKKGRPCKGYALLGKSVCYDHDFSGTSIVTAIDLVRERSLILNHSKASVVVQGPVESVPQEEELTPVPENIIDETVDTQSSAQMERPSDHVPLSSCGSAQSIEIVKTLADGENRLVDYDELEIDEEEGGNLQHLREVFEVQDIDDTNDILLQDDDDLDNGTDPMHVPTSAVALSCDSPGEWTWIMNESERWDACHSLMEEVRTEMNVAALVIKRCLFVARNEYRQAQIRAKAKVYENKSVIGGTMVGCISRLEAIRTTRPFAVVIEEASEVLEPLLFSCLAESTVKLEMIGDHRQLQPSLMSRYEFEMVNKVNTSMFQRLIEAPSGHSIPATVLSVQRRMRRNICDLTRQYYADVVEIEDHSSCGLQRIGSRKASIVGGKSLASSTGGREVPGIGPHVFLWTHSGEQKKAHVGVSRINPQEAIMACSLAAYLVSCGVPRSSIAILTPYKGQLMAMRKMLLGDSRWARLRLISRDPQDVGTCRLSTVDRFQGDEEDIVICSLVVDEKSKTAFVKVVNRMIVMLSRARLGLYILGNTGYFENDKTLPQHWRNTLELLQRPGSNDCQDATIDLGEVFTGPRTGPEIPLCCPVHRSVRARVSSPSELRLGFCTEVCKTDLTCGHKCLLPCHWPKDQHTTSCKTILDSPCDIHDAKIECHQLYKNSFGAPMHLDNQHILSYYRCEAVVELTLSCGHILKKNCWEERKINSGDMSQPLCNENSPVPFVFPSCGHSRSATCQELDLFVGCPSATRCEKMESFEPICGHQTRLRCWQAQEYSTGSKVHSCPEKVSTTLPRCGHKHKMSCGLAKRIETWSGDSCEEVGKVIEGTSYGPQDYLCKKQNQLIRTCGHNLTLPCTEAISRSTSLNPCRQKVKARHPTCGHKCLITCSTAHQLQNIDVPDAVDEISEGQMSTPSPLHQLVTPCHEKIRMVRKCGHIETIICAQTRKPLIGCSVSSRATSPLCGHDIDFPCCLRSSLSLNLIWDTVTFASVRDAHIVPQGVEPLRDPTSFDNLLKTTLGQCKGETTLQLACGHNKVVSCGFLIGCIDRRNLTTDTCEEIVSVNLPCGHSASISCQEAQRHKVGKEHVIQCDALKSKKCWNYSTCQRSALVKCSFDGRVACDQETRWTCRKGKHKYNMKICAKGVPDACPECSLDEIQIELDISSVARDEVVPRVFSAFPPDCFTNVSENLLSSRSSEQVLLDHHREKHESRLSWKSTVISLKRVPCLRVLKNNNLAVTQFEPKRFVKPKTLYGMMTKTLCESNIAKIAASLQEGTLTLLVGYATVMKTKIYLNEQIPKGKKRGGFVKSLWNEGYDSLLYKDVNGFENLIVWDPFPVQSIFRVEFSSEQLIGLAEQLRGASLPDLEPCRIKLNRPNNVIVSRSTAAAPCDVADSDDDSTADERDEIIHDALAGTFLEGLPIDTNWAGGIASGGTIPTAVEHDLLCKMKFTNKAATPFVALNQLKTLLSALPQCRLLHLLQAAELVSQSSPEEAQQCLDTYVQETKSCKEDKRMHPWSILVASRLNTDWSEQLLQAFVTVFPTQETLLSSDELLILKQSARGDDSEEIGWPEKLKNEWSQLQSNNPEKANSEAMDKLLTLTGLRKVKEEALRLWKSALQLCRMDAATRKKNPITANYCFVGNPGTGKTTVARLFASILCDSGIRGRDVIIETTAQQAKDGGGTDEFSKSVASAMGGVLFIDEAYDLDPVGDYKGRPIVNDLLTLCENRRDQISFILAGYEDDFEKKFFAYNAGLKSRFTNVIFEDFDDSELSAIWTDMRTDKGWREEDGVCRVVVKRMTKMAGTRGFGNAREIRKRLEKATQEALARLDQDFSMETMDLVVADVIGDDPRLSNAKLTRIREEIYQKVGWERVKGRVQELVDICGINYGLELSGKPPLDVFLNRMFLGNPGTGKTTCAALYGRLLKELGFLSNGDVVSKTASDFIGSVVGESQKNTSRILSTAQGKVLIIDEAYALDDSLYGKEVLDTLVEKVQGGPADDIAVLLVGYEEHMLSMFRTQNPGLSRRFPKEQAFYFDDYDENELLAILDFNLKRGEVKGNLEFREKAIEVLRVQKSQINFGNAGAVATLVKAAMLKAAARLGGEATIVVLDHVDIEDPGSARASKEDDPLAILDNLYRMEQVKVKLMKMSMTWSVSRRDGDEDPKLGHFVLTGSPGTGKTTVARAIANVLYSLHLLPSNNIKETSALNLTGDFVGQTKTKVNEALEEAKGGVLFIDEAYNLGSGSYGKEACDTIVAAMTSDSFRDVVIIIAGYPREIDAMLQSNSGLKSRFTQFFEFLDWGPTDCRSFFEMLSQRKHFSLEEGVLDAIEAGCSKLMQCNGWGNGRDVTNLWDDAKRNRDVRVYVMKSIEKMLSVRDVQEALQDMFKARQPKSSKPSDSSEPLNDWKVDPPNFAFANQDSEPNRVATKMGRGETPQVEEVLDGGTDASSLHGDAQSSKTAILQEEERDDDVPDEIWDTLQQCKHREEQRLEELESLRAEHEALQAAEEEAVRRHREELERLRLEKEHQERERAIQAAIGVEQRRKEEAEAKRWRIEEKRRKVEEERQRLEAINKRLQQISPCPAGFSWYKQGGGWRCGGGSHYVSDAALRR